MNDESSTWGSAARGAVALFVLGLIGVVALAIYSVPTLRAIPELAVLSYPTLMLVAAANSTIFLVIFVTLGTVTAPRTGLHSHVFAWASGGTRIGTRFDDHFPRGRVGCRAVRSRHRPRRRVRPVYRTRVSRTRRGGGGAQDLLASIPMRLLYGGITEEILLRWGVMAPIAFVCWGFETGSGSARRRRPQR